MVQFGAGGVGGGENVQKVCYDRCGKLGAFRISLGEVGQLLWWGVKVNRRTVEPFHFLDEDKEMEVIFLRREC